jgi:hypothetical protein
LLPIMIGTLRRPPAIRANGSSASVTPSTFGT